MRKQTAVALGRIGLVFMLAAGISAGAEPEEVSLEAFNAQGESARHKNGQAFVDPILTPLDAREAHFKKIAGLADSKGVSFEAVSRPGLFLRQRGGRLALTKCPDAKDKQDATFLVLKGLAAGDGWLSLGALTPTGHVWQNKNGELWIGEVKEGDEFQKSATFRFTKPVDPRKPPISGKAGRDTPQFDAVMLKFMEKINCTAAELAISRNGVLIESRGYGWSDQRGKTPMRPDNPMAIGSCEKPMIAAAIMQLGRAGKVDLNAPILKTLQIKPSGPVVDNRMLEVTVRQVLDHKSGWQGEPLDRAIKAAAAAGLKENNTEVVLQHLMVQKLINAPGAKADYSNFGYDVLRLLLVKTTQRTEADYVRHDLCKPIVRELITVQDPGIDVKGEPPQVWNAASTSFDDTPVKPNEPLRASAPALCGFLRCFWITGQPKKKDIYAFDYDGFAKNTTTLVSQRLDKIDFACIFNGRGDATPADIRQDLQAIIDKVEKKK